MAMTGIEHRTLRLLSKLSTELATGPMKVDRHTYNHPIIHFLLQIEKLCCSQVDLAVTSIDPETLGLKERTFCQLSVQLKTQILESSR